MAISEVLNEMCGAWAVPRPAIHRGQVTHFRFRCSMESPGLSAGDDVARPPDLRDLWKTAGGARLFEDVDHGQWGLVLLSPEGAARETSIFDRERARDRMEGDLVIGYFLGDQDRLILRTDPTAPDFGQVMIALPLDGRGDWYRPAPRLEPFLKEFGDAQGAKFWKEH
jgi:hypothetical protein